MNFLKLIKVGFVVLLMGTTLIFQAQSTYANAMVTDKYLQDQNNFQDLSPAADNEKVQQAAVGLSAWDYIKMLFSLVLVLGLLIAVLKFINKRNLNYQQNSVVRNIGGISVGSQKSVQLLHIGDSLYIVGVGDNVQLIKEVHDPEEVEQLLSYYQDKQSIVSTTPYIAELMKKFNKIPKEQSIENEDFGDLLNKRLTDIQKERRDGLDKWKEKERNN